ncbi:tRNA epoxyqueuosine(34) reductase QueG [Ketogulonicigenium vulgare]|uniref:tRNA epoxyqueuosine(34) reductase QueG n=1 Tax=Ketogulonicigenium vulgare TaxID=92945 RepID=UPI0023582C2D|nr:tRNA epoxyqueuosine(34) reductase QueG [Ketogulonicigenium vulgare]
MKARLKAAALDAGFVAMGICRPNSIRKDGDGLRAFVADGMHGEMQWLEDRIDWRADPTALWPQARSVIMLAESYAPSYNPLDALEDPARGAISVYAQGKDYHDLVKKRLKRVGRWLIEQAPGSEIKVFVDTAPVMERPLAREAGLGWTGKHGCILSRDFGNWVFLGCIFTTLDLEPDQPVRPSCGSCTACLDICPTQAFIGPGRLDPRKCVSYLTIEHSGPVPLDLRGKLGNRIYGCDDCLAICPWNKFAVEASDIRYHGDVGNPPLDELAGLDDTSFRARFSGNPIKRIGVNRFLRNVMYAIGNSGKPHLRASAQRHLNAEDPVLRDAAEWAVARLS